MEDHVLQDYGKNSVICLQGEKADRLFILKRGQLGVYVNRDNPTPKHGEVLQNGTQVAILEEEGQIVGEGGLFLKNRTASLVSLSDTTQVEHIPISAGGLRKVMIERPELSMNLCRSQAWRLKRMSGRMRDISRVAYAVERAREPFAIEYVRIVDAAAKRTEKETEYALTLQGLRERPLYILGRTLQEERFESEFLFNQAAKKRHSTRLSLQAGELLFREEDVGREIFFVRSGELEAWIGPDSIGHIGREEIVGEIAVLLKEAPRRTATVKAVTDCELDCITAPQFQELARQRPEILIGIAHLLVRRLNTINHIVCTQAFSAEEALSHLVGETDSAEAHLTALATRLSRHPQTRELAERAEKEAKKIVKRRDELLAQFQQTLTP